MAWLMIGMMTLVVFMSRYTFLEARLPLKKFEKIQVFLGYSAPAVLTAIAAPIVFVREGSELSMGMDNGYLMAGIVACVLVYLTKNTLLTVVLSMALFLFLTC
ncbi:AzlD domain-containing protein [Shewanella surugensis]|uniref:AzlD domain-containing protein n=1 Tax=Shewanella surugensis TaxID=212020 RepID=A0ABT0LD05_9GAMM|nr:AzlD domain-containing protein [Shewanella surugensis]MCL1125584.1 AzlD domain-containing protein [Shewanella surugensis]